MSSRQKKYIVRYFTNHFLKDNVGQPWRLFGEICPVCGIKYVAIPSFQDYQIRSATTLPDTSFMDPMRPRRTIRHLMRHSTAELREAYLHQKMLEL